MELLSERFQRELPRLDPNDQNYVPQLVSAILSAARAARATDVHLVPAADDLQMRWRIDGVLVRIAEFPAPLAPRVVARLKVLSQLLTYRTDVPQEGRLHGPVAQAADEVRISTFPTLFGEKVVVRLFAGPGKFHRLDDLGLPIDVLEPLRGLLLETGGVILVTGPAGSGKTTTIYAALRDLADKSDGGRSLVSLEDPIEVIVPGVSQSQVNPAAGFDMAGGLRSLLRQDPEVMMVGEIRDRGTAETVFQASLTGHLVLTTFHAGGAAQAVNRLSDMGIEPYLLRSGVRAILCQRLLRRLCACAKGAADDESRMGFPVGVVRVPTGCEECSGTGYRGRFVLTEMLLPQPGDLGRAILSRSEARELERLAVEAGMVTQYQRACDAVSAGWTSPAEVRRVLGFQS
ncbi:MAG TPA: GspE/PulE family protein [Planctomycetaceae bacterium]|jgi:type II secretory ATPase GspE/PulE/Tfp pilus assembly ATPase PilB-like protein